MGTTSTESQTGTSGAGLVAWIMPSAAGAAGTGDQPQVSGAPVGASGMPGSLAPSTYGLWAKPRGGPVYSALRVEWEHAAVSPWLKGANPDPASKQESGVVALFGWVSVNPTTIQDIPGVFEGVYVTFDSMYDRVDMRETLCRELSNMLKPYAGATLVTPFTGRNNLREEARRSFSFWHLISFLVLLASAVSIACVLTVSFLGRKRSLGILRVLGTTIKDLRRMMMVEAAYLGFPGIASGLLGGTLLSKYFLGMSNYPAEAFTVGALIGIGTLVTGVWLPLNLVKNASCDQLLNNRPVYIMSNPSCAKCGLCGGL